jgi:N-acetylglutamate synthase-like GNAT family acetyltransferase
MSEPRAIQIKPLRNPDGQLVESLEAVDNILMRAYQMPPRFSRIERYLALDPLGFVIAYCDGTLAGCGGVIAYPSGGFGWIGLIATDPDWTGRGIARATTHYSTSQTLVQIDQVC